MPRALQAKLARETDKKAVLCTVYLAGLRSITDCIHFFQHALSRNGFKCIVQR